MRKYKTKDHPGPSVISLKIVVGYSDGIWKFTMNRGGTPLLLVSMSFHPDGKFTFDPTQSTRLSHWKTLLKKWHDDKMRSRDENIDWRVVYHIDSLDTNNFQEGAQWWLLLFVFAIVRSDSKVERGWFTFWPSVWCNSFCSAAFSYVKVRESLSCSRLPCYDCTVVCFQHWMRKTEIERVLDWGGDTSSTSKKKDKILTGF